MAGVPKIAAKAAPKPDLPLVFEADLTIDDWTEAALVANRPVIGLSRRRLLIMLLPMLWFGAVLGGFAGWRPARSKLTLTQFGEYLSVFVGDIPFYVMLVGTLAILLWWAVYPWLIRRTLRRFVREAGFDRPIPLRYEIAEHGLTTTEGARESFTPWARFKRQEETRDHICLVLPAQEESIAIAKRAIPAGQFEPLRDFLESRIGQPQELPAPPEPPEDALRFEVVLDAGDRAVLVNWHQNMPNIRRSRWLGTLRGFLLASLVIPLLAILAWSFDPERLPLALALPIFWALFPALFWKPIAVFAVLAIVRLALDRPLMRWFAKHTGEMLHSQASHHPQRFAVDDRGILAEEEGGITDVKWEGVDGVERLPEHWLFRISRGSALIVPRRALQPEQAERLEALFSRHIRKA